VVLRLGGTWASRVVNTWLAGLDAEQIVVDPFRSWPDPDRTAAVAVGCDPTILCLALARAVDRPDDAGWLEGWAVAEAAAQQAIDDVLRGHTEPTEPGVARMLLDRLPGGASVVVSSSMPVRDVEWYGGPREDVRVLSNRGANGIDGVVSTALGVAAAGDGPTVCLLGDLALLHDQGGLLGAARSGVDCVFVVVDNDGGGIFSFLPQGKQLAADRFEQLFGTPHGVDLAALATVHGLEVTQPATASEVGDAIVGAVTTRGVRMVHIRTDRAANVAVHDEIHAEVARVLRSLP
jgi:2-succinyl-5-enolpyruvyl-6-hydroxy-3-cyclohexene-1-carboxylate synthase